MPDERIVLDDSQPFFATSLAQSAERRLQMIFTISGIAPTEHHANADGEDGQT